MTGIIVLCRYNSSRLPGKILKEINDKPILQYITERLSLLKDKNPFVICTSIESTDDPIVNFCIKHSINYFRGSLDNVALRFLNCAKENAFDNAVRINGDNLFLDSNLILEIIKTLESANLNFISNVKNRTFPKGMSVEVVNTRFYEACYPFFKNGDFEHVMTYFYKDELENREFVFNQNPMKSSVNLAIDTLQDFETAKLIIDKMIKKHIYYNYREIINLFEKIK